MNHLFLFPSVSLLQAQFVFFLGLEIFKKCLLGSCQGVPVFSPLFGTNNIDSWWEGHQHEYLVHLQTFNLSDITSLAFKLALCLLKSFQYPRVYLKMNCWPFSPVESAGHQSGLVCFSSFCDAQSGSRETLAQGMVPPTMGNFSHLNEPNQDAIPQVFEKIHHPDISRSH